MWASLSSLVQVTESPVLISIGFGSYELSPCIPAIETLTEGEFAESVVDESSFTELESD